MSEPAPIPQPSDRTAPPPAPHQTKAFDAAKLQALIVTVLGGLVAAGNEILAAVHQSGLVPPSHWLTVAGAVLMVAGRIEYAISHLAFQQATDNA